MYTPVLPRLAVLRSRISPESWEARVAVAIKSAAVLKEIAARVDCAFRAIVNAHSEPS